MTFVVILAPLMRNSCDPGGKDPADSTLHEPDDAKQGDEPYPLQVDTPSRRAPASPCGVSETP
jgi:hypothetical protein